MPTYVSARVFVILVALALAIASMAQPLEAGSYTVDRNKSDALTEYLHKHRLPLVGAQVAFSDDGGRQVTLYGFVATEFGKSDAEKKARHFLKQRDIMVINRIVVRPEIRELRPTPSSEEEDGATPQDPNKDPWAEIMREIQNDRMTLPDDGEFGPP
ncbi:MAG: hypothetical protein WA005_14305 [Candidatus Binataceae bacterium]